MNNYAIIGDGAAGTTAAYHIRRNDPTGRITIYSEDPNPAYYRAALTNYLMGELRAEQLFAVPPNFYSEWNVQRVLTRVNSVDTKEQRLDLSNGQKAPYDQLMIAAGSRARMPQFPGSDLQGVYPMRTMQDARFCLDQIASGDLKRAIIVGGGILGIEWVAGLRSRNVDATFLIREPAFWEGIIDKACSDLVLSRCRYYGVDVRTEEEIAEVIGRDGRFTSVKLKNSGETLEAQLLGMAIGIIPNIEFLSGSDIKTNKGIPIDEHMRTNIPNVYAGGDIAEVVDPATGRSLIMGLWEPARHHGRVAGINMSGGSATWNVETQYNATRLYDLDLAAIGEVNQQPTDDVLLDFPQEGGRISYKKLVIRDNKLVGALLLGMRKEKTRAQGRLLHKLVKLGLDISQIRDKIFDPFFDLQNWLYTNAPAGNGVTHGVEGTFAPVATNTGAGVSAVLGKGSADVPASASTAARVTLASLNRPMGAAESITKKAPISTAASPIRPSSLSSAGPGKVPPSTLRMPNGNLVQIGDRVSIGRGTQNNLVLNDPSVSEHHADIVRKGNVFVVSDAGSSTGTFVSESRVLEPKVLRHGDRIRVGATMIEFIQQVLPPRPQTGPAGLPAEPLGPARTSADNMVYGRIEAFGRTYDVSVQEVDIGRDPVSEIVVPDENVSHLHAQISRTGNDLYLRDLGSRNGTYVNGELITVPHLLRDGDVIKVGNSQLLFRSLTSPAIATQQQQTAQYIQQVATPAPPASPTPQPVPAMTPPVSPVPQVQTAAPPMAFPPAAVAPATSAGHQPIVTPNPITEPERATTSVPPAGVSPAMSQQVPTAQTVDPQAVVAPGAPQPPAPPSPSSAAPPAMHSDPTYFRPVPVEQIEGAGALPIRTPARLHGKDGPVKGINLALGGSWVMVGSDPEAQICIEQPSVSARHASFEARGADWVVTDLGSATGTFLNGTQLPANLKAILTPGDEVRIGDAVFTFEASAGGEK